VKGGIVHGSRLHLRFAARWPAWVGLTVILSAPVVECGDESPFRSAGTPEIEQRLTFYSGQTADHPNLYPAWALLGKAYLDRVPWTGNPQDLAEARLCAQKSIEIQPNLEGLLVSAAIANYGHRFTDALKWCDRCEAAAPHHPEVLAMRVEALLALGRPADARALIDERAKLKEDALVWGCRGMLLGAEGSRAEAISAYQEAFHQARAADVNEIAVWTQVASAGLCLDSGHAEEALPFLSEAEKLAPESPDMIVHFVEYDEATGNVASALKRYESLLERRADAEVHRRAALLCRRLGRLDEAHRHRDAAEQIWQAALENGEVYPLEGLANLYCDWEMNLPDAVRFATENLRHKSDAAAHATRDRAQRLQPGAVR